MTEPDPRQIAAGQQTIPLAQLHSGKYPELILEYMVRQARAKMVEAMEQADLIADPESTMVTIRVETMAMPRVTP